MSEPMLFKPITGVVQETSKRNQYIATICVSIGAVCAGTALAWTSPVLPQIQLQDTAAAVANVTDLPIFNSSDPTNSTGLIENATTTTTTARFLLTKPEASLVGAMLAIGALVSAIPAGFIADKYGRKKANLFLTVPFVINWIFIVFAVNPYMLYIGRFFSGIATGAMCVTAPMYIGEIAEVAVRGTLGSFFQMFLCFGILLTYTFGAFTSWIGLSWILMIFPFVFAVCLYFMPETPVYLVKIGDLNRAEDCLKFLRGQKYDPRDELILIRDNLDKAAQQSASFTDVFRSKGNRKAIISAFALMTFQQLSGVNAVIFYTVPIFKSAGSEMPPDLAAILVGVVQLIVAYIAAMIIDKKPRRFYIMLSISGSILCLFVLGLYFHLTKHGIHFPGIGILPLAGLVLFIVFFSLGLGPIPWMIMSELFAPEIKGIASGLSVMCNWILVFCVTFLFPIANDSLGGHITFYFFTCIMIIGDIYVYFLIPETKGKTIQEIQRILRK